MPWDILGAKPSATSVSEKQQNQMLITYLQMATVPFTDNRWRHVCTDVSKWPGVKSANPPWGFCVSTGIGVAIFHIHATEWKYDIQISKRFKVPVATLCYTYIWSENMIYLYTIGSKSLRRCYVLNIYERVQICKYDIQIYVTAASLCFMHI